MHPLKFAAAMFAAATLFAFTLTLAPETLAAGEQPVTHVPPVRMTPAETDAFFHRKLGATPAMSQRRLLHCYMRRAKAA